MAEGSKQPRDGSQDIALYAVFGNPVLHSRSPQLYNSQFTLHGIKAFYTRILTFSGRRVCEIIRSLPLSGANITTPFKEEVVSCTDELSPDAELIGAVNTIVVRNGLLEGHNTDASGVTGSLREAGHDPAGKRCMVLGAGGAGRAAAVGLVRAGAEVVLVNRNIERFAGFARKLGCKIAEPGGSVAHPGEFDIIVLTLPPGVFPFDRKQLNSRQVIVDANYRTDGAGSNAGWPCEVIKGDRWLLHQAVDAYRLFSGLHADVGVMDRAMAEKTDVRAIVPCFVGRDDSRRDDLRRDVPGRGDPGRDFIGRDVPFENCMGGSLLVVDAAGKSDAELKKIIDEEKNRALGS